MKLLFRYPVSSLKTLFTLCMAAGEIHLDSPSCHNQPPSLSTLSTSTSSKSLKELTRCSRLPIIPSIPNQTRCFTYQDECFHFPLNLGQACYFLWSTECRSDTFLGLALKEPDGFYFHSFGVLSHQVRNLCNYLLGLRERGPATPSHFSHSR